MTSDRARRSPFSSSSSEIDSNRPSAPRVVLADGVGRFSRSLSTIPFRRRSFSEVRSIANSPEKFLPFRAKLPMTDVGVASSFSSVGSPRFCSLPLARKPLRSRRAVGARLCNHAKEYSEHRDVYTPGDNSVVVPHFFRRRAVSSRNLENRV